uniref:Secreted protein n=1 Tax=Cacopsylla melanoneura TaxID=428564 RepID=A0A8D9EZN5_9HEMI
MFFKNLLILFGLFQFGFAWCENCCIDIFEHPHHSGSSLRYCDCSRSCTNLPSEWKNRVTSVKVHSIQQRLPGKNGQIDNEFPMAWLYEWPNCQGNGVLINQNSNCNGSNLASEKSKGPTSDRSCGDYEMDDKAQSLFIMYHRASPPVVDRTHPLIDL